ncbi:MAG: SHOCT domain-containing protein [Acutalibacteraceae bacterium]
MDKYYNNPTTENEKTNSATLPQTTISYEEQYESLKKLKELLDAGIITDEEFTIKKKEILGI